MRSSRKIRFSREAEQDLREILQYTLITWGPGQKTRYQSMLDRSFTALLDFPDMGTAAGPEGLLQHPIHEHVAFYRKTAFGIAVYRVLHKRRLPVLSDIDSADFD